jgi:glucose-6-phosphate 1-dehydrogenase
MQVARVLHRCRTGGRVSQHSSVRDADAIVFFGAIGDLAFKKVFPALQAMAKRGRLSIPIVGVARSDWTLERLRERAKESVLAHGTLDAPAFDNHESLFARADAVKAEWRVVDGILGDATPLETYEPGTWGPAAADQIIVESGGWHRAEPRSS